MSKRKDCLPFFTAQAAAAVSAVCAVSAVAAGTAVRSAGVVSAGIYWAVSGLIVAAFCLVWMKRDFRRRAAAAVSGVLLVGAAGAGIYYAVQLAAWPPSVSADGLHPVMALMAAAALGNASASQYLTGSGEGPARAVCAAAGLSMRCGALAASAALTGLALMDITKYAWLDASLVFSSAVFLVMAGCRMGLMMLHTSLDSMEERRIGRIIMDIPGVLGYHRLQGRVVGDVTVLAFHLEIDKALPPYKACAVSDAVEFALCAKYGPCDLTIRVEPR